MNLTLARPTDPTPARRHRPTAATLTRVALAPDATSVNDMTTGR